MRPKPEAVRLSGTLAIVVVLSSALAAPDASAATLHGSVTIVERGGAHGDPSTAVVWLEGVEGPPPSPGRAAIAMRDKKFDPTVVLLPVGSTLTFPNADPILHNVFSVSTGNHFDLGLY